MLDRDPAPQGFENRCTYCGKLLTESETVYEIVDTEGEGTQPLHFCSEAHAKAYRTLIEESLEEANELKRSGPT